MISWMRPNIRIVVVHVTALVEDIALRLDRQGRTGGDGCSA
jgi:hypothetical protein